MTDWRDSLRERLAGLGLRPEREIEIVEELAQHLDDHVRELVAGGTDRTTARSAALADLDLPGELARRLAEIDRRPPLVLPPPGVPSRGRWLQARWQDIRYSIRSLRRSPIFTVTVLATFALTIGPTTAILSVGNWLLWKPTPGVHEPHRLAVIWFGQWTDRSNSVSVSPSGVSYLNLQDLREESKALSGLAGFQESSATIAGDNLPPAYETAAAVTADFFDVLGIPVIAGRPLHPGDDQDPQGSRVALISERLARRGFGDAGRAVNQRLLLNGRPMTIAGVVPGDFAGLTPLSRVSVWFPGSALGYVNHFADSWSRTTRSDGFFYRFVARLAPSASFESARAELEVIVPALAERHPDENGKFRTVRARLFPGLGPSELQRNRYAGNLRVLLAIGGALLLLGCANVTNMLTVRSVRTGRDRAIRLALGASRLRLTLLQLTESGLLAGGGAALGLLLAVWLEELIVSLLFPGIPAGQEFSVPLDPRVLGLTLGVSLACGLVAGLAPALMAPRGGITPSMAAGGRSVTGTSWLRAGFAGVQLALSLALVTGSLLLVTTLRNFYAIDLGFDPSGVSRHTIEPASHGYSPERALAYFQDVVKRLQERPGMDAVSVSGRSPFGSSRRVRVQDPNAPDGPPVTVLSNYISEAYFDVLRTPIVRGRAFTEAEAMTPAGVTTLPVVVGASLAQRLFADANPIGRSFVIPGAGDSPAREAFVVGVARDVYWNNLTERPMFLYQPYPHYSGGGILLVRSTLPLPEVSRIVEGVAREVDPSLPVSFSQSLSSGIESEVSEQRTFAWVLSLAGWIAFVLAAVGLYGLLAQSVSERTREFGIRLAIGSGRSRIFTLVLKQAAWIGTFGIVAGLALAAFGTRLIESQLFGVTRLDVSTYLVAAGALALVVFVAGLWPARAATQIQPMEALRIE